jgi:DeoR/GlpR family transcriptional regulator of sugar metabolism
MATSSTLRGEERRAAILATVRRDGSGQIDALAAGLGVSEMTVRRDLDDLESEGLLRRVRGGAVAVAGPRQFGERRSVRMRAKQIIAAKAAALIPASGAVALDASSTAGTLVGALKNRTGLVIATNSFDNFTALHSGDATAVLIGGEQDPATGSFVGRIACDAAESLLYEAFFTSAYAVHPTHGTSEASLAESQVKRAFAARSTRTILCADSSKLDSVAVAATLEFGEIHSLITELDPVDARLDPYREHVAIV